MGEDCFSEWKNVPAGVPQGTKLGPWLFILMIDDINTSNTELWKYVDDTTIAECVDKKKDSRIQSDVEELIANKLFNSITCNSDHKLHELLPPRNNCEFNLRRKKNFHVPLAKTKRLKNTFIYSNCN